MSLIREFCDVLVDPLFHLPVYLLPLLLGELDAHLLGFPKQDLGGKQPFEAHILDLLDLLGGARRG